VSPPGMRFDGLEAGRGELCGERFGRPTVGGSDRVIERLHIGAEEEAQQECAARAQNSRELVENAADRIGLVMNQ